MTRDKIHDWFWLFVLCVIFGLMMVPMERAQSAMVAAPVFVGKQSNESKWNALRDRHQNILETKKWKR